MRIALLTDGIFPHVIGGMQRHSFYLAKYLAAAGVQVDLYHTIPGGKKEGAFDLFTGEEKKNLRSFVIPFPDFGRMPGHYIRESYEYSCRVWKKLNSETLPDFIYVKGFAGWELLNRKSKGEKLPPVGLNFHGYEMFQPQPGFVSWLQSRFLLRSPVLFNVRHADYLFSYGGKITALIRSLGAGAEKIIEIPTGISREWLFTGTPEVHAPRRFVFVGRNERRKGLCELHEAIAQLPGTMEFAFSFVGDIPPKKWVKDARLTYHGEIKDSAALKNILRDADVLVCPSFSEGMPNVVMEALASGLAVIATDTGATSEMVNESNGWLISPGDVAQLAGALEKAITLSPDALAAKKAGAVKHVENNFLWEKVAGLTIEKISRVCLQGSGDVL
ncbi:MAG TPA: glycosyltransferase family 4 protein [Bacteroidia bacterium]|nr:glycosyltransferase family 4 protein [Bacteroidia bacterium]